MKKLFVIVLMLSFVHLSGADFKVDTEHSDVGFSVKYMLVSHVKGKFTKFAGILSLDDKTKQLSKMVGTVDVFSISTENEQRDKHLISADFFDAKKYPYMNFVLLKQRANEIAVKVTIKDVTQVVNMKLNDLQVFEHDGEKYVRFHIHGKLSRKKFHISFNPLFEATGFLIADTIKLNIKIEGIQGHI